VDQGERRTEGEGGAIRGPCGEAIPGSTSSSSRACARRGGRRWIENQAPDSRKGATIGWLRRYQAADGQL